MIHAGDVYGRLTAIGDQFRVGRNTYRVVAKCQCGNIVAPAAVCLREGLTTSCGCRRVEVSAARLRTHGLRRHPLYKVWAGIVLRCENCNASNYAYYGGRGIAMCREWRMDFQTFYDWATANGWKRGLEIDRFPDMNGNYEPSNCRVATRRQNRNNTRANVFISAFGETMTATEWSMDARCSVDAHSLARRIRRGWIPCLAIVTRPDSSRHRPVECVCMHCTLKAREAQP